MDEFADQVGGLRDGTLSFVEFELATRERWESTARLLMRRWRIPSWVEVGDVVQDLLVGAWDAVWRYDPKRSTMSLGSYVRVMAFNEAQRHLHKVRGVDMHSCVGASNIDTPFAVFSEEEIAGLESKSAVPADQHERAERSRRMLEVCQSMEELLSLQALHLTQNFGASAELLYQEASDVLKLRDQEHATRVLVRSVYAVAARAA